MTNSENIIHFGPNAYGKPATALNILRETVMGRELFDFAFKTYCTRWAFKHPTPADFFRTMEDASAVDLDWFWRSWFYDITPVDIALDTVKAYQLVNGTQLPVKMDTITNQAPPKPFEHITKIRNRESGMKFLVEVDTTLRDFYYYYKPDQITTKEAKNRYQNLELMPDSSFKQIKENYVYELKFSNKGGTVMPIIIKWNYSDGTDEIERINAYIWRKDEKSVTKTFMKNKKVASIQLDPYKETCDINERNNSWNVSVEPSKFEVFKNKAAVRGQSSGENPMQKAKQK